VVAECGGRVEIVGDPKQHSVSAMVERQMRRQGS
jgi:hypothetical protein